MTPVDSSFRSPRRRATALKVVLALVAVGMILQLAPATAQLFSGEPAGLASPLPAPSVAGLQNAPLTVVRRPGPRYQLPGVRFSFAVISDLHEETSCGLGYGPILEAAVDLINRLRPAFVVGLGDLVAGGGDCLAWGKGWPERDLEKQLLELDQRVLSRLEVPFVPVGGNHDLTSLGSRDPTYPRNTWNAFWRTHRHRVLAQARPGLTQKSSRFTYRGVGFSLVGYYDTFGLHPSELSWIRKNLQPADLVFRHINPWGVSCIGEGHCGIAIRNWPIKRMELLTQTLRARRIQALFSGHTHTFFDGWCGGMRFVNTGSLGTRSMEYLKGWDHSPYKKRQAFVWVDVLTNASLRITFFVWDPAKKAYRPFDKRSFPATVTAERQNTPYFEQGLAATCVANRRAPSHPAAFFAATARPR